MSRTYTYAHLETKMAKKRNPFGQQVKSFYGEVSIPTLGVEMTGNDGISSTIATQTQNAGMEKFWC